MNAATKLREAAEEYLRTLFPAFTGRLTLNVHRGATGDIEVTWKVERLER